MTTVFTSYVDPRDPREYWNADTTSVIANNLPDHSVIRRDHRSLGYQFLDQAAGVPLQVLSDELKRQIQDMFLGTASKDAADHAWTTQLRGDWNLESPDNEVNMVRNSSFEVVSDESWFADEWDWNGSGLLDVATGVASNKALRLTMGVVSPQIAQRIERFLQPGSSVLLSGWVKIPVGAVGRLRVEFVHVDDTSTFLTITLDDGADEWVRYFATTAVLKQTAYMIIRGDVSMGAIDFDNLQLERGTVLSPWRPHIFDSLRAITTDDTPPVAVMQPQFVQFAGFQELPQSQFDWWFGYPTRLELYDTEASAGPDVSEFNLYDTFTDFIGEQWPVALRKSGNDIQRFSPTANDIFANFSLRFWTLDGQFVEDTYTLEALTVFRDRVWAVILKDDWSGNSKRYLAVASLRHPLQPQLTPTAYTDYLEVTTLLELTGVTTAITAMSFFNGNPEALYMGDGSTLYTTQLHYDYMALDRSRGQLFLRERYDDIVVLNMNERMRNADV